MAVTGELAGSEGWFLAALLLLGGCGPEAPEPQARDLRAEQLCRDFCDAVEPCRDEPMADCFGSCVHSDGWDPESRCRPLREANFECYLTLTCEEFEERRPVPGHKRETPLTALPCGQINWDFAVCRARERG